MSPTLHNQDLSYQLINSAYLKNGKVNTQKRLIFDPGHVHFYQVQRPQPDRIGSKNKKSPNYHEHILGIRVHTFAEHFFLNLLTAITFGCVKPKSLAVRLNGTTVFVNSESYRKWRNINGEALSSMGLLQPIDIGNRFRQRVQVRHEIIYLLRYLQNEIPQPRRHPSITSSNDPFEMASAALKWAERLTSTNYQFQGLSNEEKKTALYRVASFFILLSARIERDCEGDYLRISDSVTAHNRRKRNERNETKTVYELALDKDKGYKTRKFYTADALSSISTRNDPITAKKLLNSLGKRGVDAWSKFLIALIKNPIRINKGDKISSALAKHIEMISKALQEQFTEENPAPTVISALKNSYAELAQSGLVTDINKRGQEAKSAVALLASFNLLKEMEIVRNGEFTNAAINYRGNPSLHLTFSNILAFEEKPREFADAVSHLDVGQKDVLTQLIFLIFREGVPKERAFMAMYPQLSVEQSKEFLKIIDLLKLPCFAPQINALSGKFDNEHHSKCSNEALQFAEWHQRLSFEDQRGFEKFLIAKIESTMIEPKKREIFIADFASQQEINIKTVEEFYTYLEKLERVGRLVDKRYLENNLERCLENLEINNFDNFAFPLNNMEPPPVHITADRPPLNLLLKERRSAEEQLRMINTYFPKAGLKALLPNRKEPPRFDLRGSELRKLLNKQQYYKTLFHIVPNKAGDGDCSPGALAQGAFGKYHIASGECIGPDYSDNVAITQLIRNAIAQYMIDNNEQFQQYVEIVQKNRRLKGLQAKEDTTEAREKAVIHQAREIRGDVPQINLNGDRIKPWLGMTEFKAISEILGRPVHILEDKKIVLDQNGAIEMNKINDHYDAEPIYILLTEGHTELMLPKRQGIIHK